MPLVLLMVKAKREELRKKRNRTVHIRLDDIRRGAELRDLPFPDRGSTEERALMDLFEEQKQCVYCGDFRPEGIFFGLDRVDTTQGYTPENVVVACIICNRMKHLFHQAAFLHAIDYIAVYNEKRPINHDVMVDPDGPNLFSFFNVGRAWHRKKHVTLTAMQIIDLWASACYLCGKQPAFGIDREDSSFPYLEENARPACFPCNYMKSTYPLDRFIMHCCSISRFSQNLSRAKKSDRY